MIKYFYDTSALINDINKLNDKFFYTSTKVLKEIEEIINNKEMHNDLITNAIKVKKTLLKNPNIYEAIPSNNHILDIMRKSDLEFTGENIVIATAKYLNNKENIIYKTNSLSAFNIAKNVFKLNVQNVFYDEIKRSKGYLEVWGDCEYINNSILKDDKMLKNLKLYNNEYLIINNIEDNEIKFYIKSENKIKEKVFQNIDDIDAKNSCEKLAMNILVDRSSKFKFLLGKESCKKSYLSMKVGEYMVNYKKEFNGLILIDGDLKYIGKVFSESGYLRDYIMKFKSMLQYISEENIKEMISLKKLYLETIDSIKGINFSSKYIIVKNAHKLNNDEIIGLLKRTDKTSSVVFLGEYTEFEYKHLKTNSLLNLMDISKDYADFASIFLREELDDNIKKIINKVKK